MYMLSVLSVVNIMLHDRILLYFYYLFIMCDDISYCSIHLLVDIIFYDCS